jgi:hypothetical protein
MAVQTTEEFKNGGATSYAITIEYLQASDIKVRIGGVLQTYVASSPSSGEYTVSGTTVTLGAQAAAGSGNVHIYRETDVNTAAAVFAAGSSIRAADLNAIHDMARFGLSEARSTTIESDIKDGAITSAKIKDDTIVNADVNASAAIAGTKISPNFGSQNIVTSGTVDGRDVSVDGTKLDGIETGATADQTAAEIKSLYEGNSNTNVLSDAEKTKLAGIETAATADQTNAEIRTAVEAATDSNVFTDADHTKLNGIETAATADQTGAEIKSAYEGEANTNAFTDAEKTKLSGIETSATADQTGAEIKTAYEAESNTNAFTDAEKTKLSGIATGADVTSSNSLNALTDVNTSGVADGKILKYQASSSSFIIADDGGSGSGGATAFTGLTDTPANYGSAANKTLKVNSSGNAVEFVDVTTSFTGLTDTPANFTGSANKTVKVNSSANALEFVDANTDLVNDTSPQLGGNLDLQASTVTTSTTNGNIKLLPDGTGVVEVRGVPTLSDGSSKDAAIKLNCAQNSHGQTIQAPPHSAGVSNTFTLPTSATSGLGGGGAFLKTSSTGQISFDSNGYQVAGENVSITGGGKKLTFGQGNSIVFDSDNNNTYEITLTGPNTLTKDSNFTLPEAPTGDSFLVSDSNGVMSFTTDVSLIGGQLNCHDLYLSRDASNNDPVVQPAAQANITLRCCSTQSGTFGSILDNSGLQLGRNTQYVKIKAQSDQTGQASWDLSLPITAGSNGQVLTTNGSGVTSWEDGASTVAGGAIYENSQTISASHTIPVGSNGMSAGPVTINNGVTLTISNGSAYTIV